MGLQSKVFIIMNEFLNLWSFLYKNKWICQIINKKKLFWVCKQNCLWDKKKWMNNKKTHDKLKTIDKIASFVKLYDWVLWKFLTFITFLLLVIINALGGQLLYSQLFFHIYFGVKTRSCSRDLQSLPTIKLK